MSGPLQIPLGVRACPFCGMATLVPHETQEGCIAALHEEIGRTRTILANLKPHTARDTAAERDTSSEDGADPVQPALGARAGERELS